MKENKENGQTANTANLENIANDDTASGIVPDVKTHFSEMSIKELIARPEVQEAIGRCVSVPDVVVVKKARKAFQPKESKTKTQKIEVMSGTSLDDAVSSELTLVDMEIDEKTVNKKYRIVDYTFGLVANMNGQNFSGYAAKGLKLLVTKFEEVK